MRRRHPMPFGCTLLDNGRVRFRLWAPAIRQVELCLGPSPYARLPMQALASGWYELETAMAHPGTLYAFRIDGDVLVPDPASRFQPHDAEGPSEVIEPRSWQWRDRDWRGRPWEEAVLYELHVGSFTPEGNYDGVRYRLDELAALGITALQLMPLADFPGRRNWGYDGVLPFAPDHRYGRPEDLKALVEAAHQRGMMVLLDVVYNHFGPHGNFLPRYAPHFFTDRHHTPWGDAIDFDRHWVREFFIHNALYWLQEYHLDGLRLDAVHAIHDDQRPDILQALATRVREAVDGERPVHLILENDNNQARYLSRREDGAPTHYTAQWNDDFHHAMHCLLTGEGEGYYADFARQPLAHLGRCLTEGFAFQGEPSPFRGNAPRGEPSAHLPPSAFVSLLQSHDQIGNRAYGERLGALIGERKLRLATTVQLLTPMVPMLFMGQEWNAPEPFPYFCDLPPPLDAAVREGRRREFAAFSAFVAAEASATLPDPCAERTYCSAIPDHRRALAYPGRRWRAFHRRLLRLRREHIVPRLGTPIQRQWQRLAAHALQAQWCFADGSRLTLLANFGAKAIKLAAPPPGRPLCASVPGVKTAVSAGRLPAECALWLLEEEKVR